jgi:hypothetical protein
MPPGPSLSFRALLRFGPNSLRQLLVFELTPNCVLFQVGNICEALDHVFLLMEARCAAIDTGMRRRRRASLISWPSLCNARLTGKGSTTDERLILILKVHYYGL